MTIPMVPAEGVGQVAVAGGKREGRERGGQRGGGTGGSCPGGGGGGGQRGRVGGVAVSQRGWSVIKRAHPNGNIKGIGNNN